MQPLTQKLNSIEKCYNNRQLSPKVIQIGTGNFLRAFAGSLIERLNRETDFKGGIAMVQPTRNGKIKQLQEQNYLYTILSRGNEGGVKKMVVRSVSKGIDPYTNYLEFCQLAESTHVEYIISNTTEAGLQLSDKDSVWGTIPESFPAKLCALLYHRYLKLNKKAPLIHILPCELVPENGKFLKKLVLKMTDRYKLENGFKNWLHSKTKFYNTLVDRIVPGYPKDEYEGISQKLGYNDPFLIAAEDFNFWAIESDQPVFPEIKDSGLLYTDKLEYYHQRKVQLLNASHTAMVPLALSNRIETVKEFTDHEYWGEYFRGLLYEELSIGLDEDPEGLLDFMHTVISRFSNPYICHYFKDIALNTLSKIQTRLVPVLIAYYKTKKQWPAKLCMSLAAYIYVFSYTDLIEIPQDLKAELSAELTASKTDRIKKALAQKTIWGKDLSSKKGLVKAIAQQLPAKGKYPASRE